jgi:hypothetical protein
LGDFWPEEENISQQRCTNGEDILIEALQIRSVAMQECSAGILGDALITSDRP